MPTSEQELLASMSAKSCDLDPAPTCVVKENIDVLLPVLTAIVNRSLETGTFPTDLKSALVKPLLKKQNLDRETLSNYRLVSNLAFLGKVIEKVVAKRISAHIEAHGLGEEMQSAYRKFHSTETSLLRVQNDNLLAMDRNQAVLLVLLDLKAAFDTLDHEVLLRRLSVRY